MLISLPVERRSVFRFVLGCVFQVVAIADGEPNGGSVVVVVGRYGILLLLAVLPSAGFHLDKAKVYKKNRPQLQISRLLLQFYPMPIGISCITVSALNPQKSFFRCLLVIMQLSPFLLPDYLSTKAIQLIKTDLVSVAAVLPSVVDVDRR